MKKIVVSLLIWISALTVVFAENVRSQKKNSRISVGMTVQDLSNQIWSGSCVALKKLVTADGGKMVYLDCSNNSSTQIQQLENFISAKVNVIIVQPVDKNAVEQTLAKARQRGIKVYCWDEDVQNADICWLIDNYALGKTIGEQAASWINSKNNGVAEVAVLDYPQIPILLERGKGIVDALKEKAPNAKIVAQSSAINPTEGMAKMETIFQKNPNVKVVCCIGGGGAVGANEAAKAAGKIGPDFGIFAADCTEQEMAAMKNNEGNRMSVLITGGPDEIAKTIYGWVKKLAAGESVEKKVYRVTIPVTAANLSRYYK
jgi:ribose transport system substrate-binding protein